jgi:hypothetical protein
MPSRLPRALHQLPANYTTAQRAQNELNGSVHEVLDAICINIIDKMDPLLRSQLNTTHDLARIPSDVLLAFFDNLFLQHAFNRLHDELDNIRVARGITSISELLAQFDMLQRWATQGNIIWNDAYIIGILSQSLNAMGDNPIVIKYHETYPLPTLNTYIPFVTRQEALKGYAPAIVPIQQGLQQINALQLNEQQLLNQKMAAQLQTLTTMIQSLQKSNERVPTHFCSTHGPCFHPSLKCKKPHTEHNNQDTQLNWSNKQQYLDKKAKKT